MMTEEHKIPCKTATLESKYQKSKKYRQPKQPKKTKRLGLQPSQEMRTETRTAKLKILNLTNEQVALIQETCEAYIGAANLVSQYIFDNGFPLSAQAVQKVLYRDVRDRFNLPAQMACCVFRTVTARYKTTKTQLETTPWVFQEDGMDEPMYIHRSLEWLRKPLNFHTPTCDQSRDRSYRFLADGKVSFGTLEKPIAAEFEASPNFEPMYTSQDWEMGTAKLEKHHGDWFLAIPFERKVAVTNGPARVVGIDRGIVNLVAIADDTGKKELHSGAEIRRKRTHFATTRAKLQAKGTKSAKRRLAKISGRENRWMSDVNHCLSKALVSGYEPGTLFVLENLVDVSESGAIAKFSKGGKKERRDWAYFQLECFLAYKAEAAGMFILIVDSAFTSQRCPDCGRIDKAQRHHDKHEYRCKCGFSENDDLTAALNLLALGKAFLTGNPEPCFRRGNVGIVDGRALRESRKTEKQRKAVLEPAKGKAA